MIAIRSLKRGLAALAPICFTTVLAFAAVPQAEAFQIQKVTSPGGITAWLVEEHAVPLVAMRFSFAGGSSSDPADRPGVSYFLSGMLDEGAGDMTSEKFQDRISDLAIKLSFDADRDEFEGSLQTLTENRDAAVELLRLAINQPRFDADAMERIRGQLLAGLAFAAKDPDRVASREWFSAAFPNHPYGRPAAGTVESLAKITREDLEGYRKRVFAKDTLDT